MPDEAAESLGTKQHRIRPNFCSKQNPKELKLRVDPMAAVYWKHCNWSRAVKHTGIAPRVVRVFGLAVPPFLGQAGSPCSKHLQLPVTLLLNVFLDVLILFNN